MANENLKKQMVVKLGTTTNTEAQLISNMVDGALSGKGGNDPELENLKKQMVIKLGTTTNEDAQIISNMVDNAAGGGGGGSIPLCEVTYVNTGSDMYELEVTAFDGVLAINADNTFMGDEFYELNPNVPTTIKYALINTLGFSGEVINLVPTKEGTFAWDTPLYGNYYSNLNNIKITVSSQQSPTGSTLYKYLPTVIDITKPSSYTFSADFDNL